MNEEEVFIEFIKCKNDVVYFIKNYFQDYTLPEPRLLKQIYPRQVEILNTLLNNHYLILMGSRQVGKTIILIAFICWLILFHPNYLVAVLSRKADFTNELINEVKKALGNLKEPFTVQLEDKGKHTKKNLASEIVLINGSSVKAISVPKANPEEAGRGLRAGFIFIDEAAHIPMLDKILSGINFTTSRTFPRYEEMKIPYGICLSSTPNGMSGIGETFYSYWNSAENNNSIYKAIKFHWKEVPEYTEEWYKEQCKKLNNDKRTILQELDLVFLPSKDSFFDEEIVERLQKLEEVSTIKVKLSFEYDFYLFEQPNNNDIYLIGIDSATRRGSDFSCISVVKFSTGEQVAEYHGKCTISDLCEKILDKIILMFPNCVLIPENNGVGNQVTEYCERKYRSKLFFTPKKDMKKTTFVPGFVNTTITRPQLLDALYGIITESPNVVKSKILKSQLIGLRKINNRIEGNHDDSVFAFGFTQWARTYYPNIITSMISTSNETISSFMNLYNERYNVSLLEENNEQTDNIMSQKTNDDLFNSFCNLFLRTK